MKSPRAVGLLALLACALGNGCESARETRIRENRALYDSLDPFSRKLVREGLFNLGFSAGTVAMSLGKPDAIAHRDTPDGPVEIWTYKNFLYGDLRHLTVGARDPGTTVQRPLMQRNAPTSAISNPAGAPTPTVADMSGPPLATLHLELRDGHVIGAHIDL